MSDAPRNKPMKRDFQREYSKRLGLSHVNIQKAAVEFAMPLVILLTLLLSATDPRWQFFAAAATTIVLWGAMWFAYLQNRAGHTNASGTIMIFSVIAAAAIVCSLLHDMAVPMIIICMSGFVYASLFSRRLLIAAGAATAITFSLREIVVYLSPSIMHPLAVWQESTISIILVFLMLPLIAIILRNAQSLDAGLIKKVQILNEEQTRIIQSASSVTEVLNLSIMEIRTLSDTFASQTQDQSTAIGKINNAVDVVRSIAGQTAESATTSKKAAQELDAKATASSRQLQDLGKGFSQVVDGNQNAQTEFDDLAQQAESIEDILRSNKEIAGQIKILAVNAGIQAAKAGEYGDGFRVVANQLKALISRTEKSLIQSRGLLEDIRIRARQSSDTILRSAKLLQKQLDDLNATGRLIHDVTASFVDSVRSVDQIQTAADAQHKELDQIAASIDYVEFSANNLNDGTHQLLEEVQQMASSLSRLQEVLLPLSGEPQ